MKIKILCFFSYIFIILSISSYSQDLLKAFDAYNKQDFETAYKEWLPLAENGDAIAQSSLGILYKSGEGVIQDFEMAFKWFKLSAEQGYAFAQTMLGNMYDDGLGIKENNNLAYMWLFIASSTHDPDAKILLQILSEEMSKINISEVLKKVDICYNQELKNCENI